MDKKKLRLYQIKLKNEMLLIELFNLSFCRVQCARRETSNTPRSQPADDVADQNRLPISLRLISRRSSVVSHAHIIHFSSELDRITQIVNKEKNKIVCSKRELRQVIPARECIN